MKLMRDLYHFIDFFALLSRHEIYSDYYEHTPKRISFPVIEAMERTPQCKAADKRNCNMFFSFFKVIIGSVEQSARQTIMKLLTNDHFCIVFILCVISISF